MEIRKINMEIEKNWKKFPFKKLGTVFCLFLFGIVTFISGNLSQVNAASSSTVLPVAKGGTGSNSASGARTNLNAQETLVSGTNIKSIFGQSLLGSGNLNPITINKTSDLVIGETALLRAGFGSTVTFYGVTCVFDTGVCSWALKPYGDAYFVYDTGDGVVKSYTKASAASTTDISLKLLSIKSGQSWAKGFILMTTGHYEYEFYKGVGNGAFYFIRRTS